jgi:hypothetical protein
MEKEQETFPSQVPSGGLTPDKSKDEGNSEGPKKSIFTKIREAEAIPKPASPSGFSEWLIGQKGQGGKVGTFAMFATGQDNWPNSGSKESYSSIVSGWGMKEREGFKQAWEAYEQKDRGEE